MTKGDIIIVYKVCVKSFSDKEAEEYMSTVVQKMKFLKTKEIVQYFVPVHKESEHPVEVIDTGNLNNNAYNLLEELLKELSYEEKIL